MDLIDNLQGLSDQNFLLNILKIIVAVNKNLTWQQPYSYGSENTFERDLDQYDKMEYVESKLVILLDICLCYV